ncbi:MAG: glycoside hydrolase family protein [Prolixibacteraceae bacterium]|nr:glycoside hydrolase family protein [Prolixibacteraceae bacterium]
MSVVVACKSPSYFYEAQPVDLKVIRDSGKISVEGTSVFQLPDSFVWCGSPIRIKDQYFMFYSAWESGTAVPSFTDSWVLFSKIGLAVSDSPYGNYRSLKLILKGRKDQGDSTAWDAQMVHNPLIKSFNGKYYLYYGSGKDPGVQPKGSPGENLSKRNRVQQSQQIGVIEFNSVEDLLAGQFTRFNQPLLSPRTRVKDKDVVDPSPPGTIAGPDNLIVVNPAVEYRPADGKYLLFFKGNLYDPQWRGVHGVAVGDSPTGPFTATDRFVFDIDDGKGNKVSAEDPYVWYHRKDKLFYAVMKDFTGKLTGGEPGLALMQSADGMDWVPAPSPLFMKKELILKDGTRLKVDRLERPQLLLDRNGAPLALFAACSVDNANPKQDGGTFNVQIPLKKMKLRK